MYGRVKLTPPYDVEVGLAAVPLSGSGGVHGCLIQALCPGQNIWIGASSAVTSANGFLLTDGASLPLEIANANQIYAIADAAAQHVRVLPFYRN